MYIFTVFDSLSHSFIRIICTDNWRYICLLFSPLLSLKTHFSTELSTTEVNHCCVSFRSHTVRHTVLIRSGSKNQSTQTLHLFQTFLSNLPQNTDFAAKHSDYLMDSHHHVSPLTIVHFQTPVCSTLQNRSSAMQDIHFCGSTCLYWLPKSSLKLCFSLERRKTRWLLAFVGLCFITL